MRSKTFQEQRWTNRGVPNFLGMKKNKQIVFQSLSGAKRNKQLFLKLFRSEEEQTKVVQKGSKTNKKSSSQTCSKWQSKTRKVITKTYILTLEACTGMASCPACYAHRGFDGCTRPDEPELQHNTHYFSLPISVLLWLSSLKKAGQDAMPVQGCKGLWSITL